MYVNILIYVYSFFSAVCFSGPMEYFSVQKILIGIDIAQPQLVLPAALVWLAIYYCILVIIMNLYIFYINLITISAFVYTLFTFDLIF